MTLLFSISCSATNPAAGSNIIEYVAKFPNVTVNAGDEYKACVLPLTNLDADSLICTTGHNSPATRPEFVDLSLNASSSVGQVMTEEDDPDEDDGLG